MEDVMQFTKATKSQSRLRLAFVGPAGSGKTYSSLAVATNLGARVAVIDTEHGSASKYADLFEFDVLTLTSFSPKTYVDAIQSAEKSGYDVCVIDSLSHAWMGKDGALEQVDRKAKTSTSGNSFAAWRDVTPMHNAMVEALLASNMHLIVTMRTKTEYVIEENDRGKKTPRKVGLAPVQRDGLEYEFDVVADLTPDNLMVVSKTRCPALSGQAFDKPGRDVAQILSAWLSDGSPAPKMEPVDMSGYGVVSPEMLATIRQEIADACPDLDQTTGEPKLLGTMLAAYRLRDLADLPADKATEARGRINAYRAKRMAKAIAGNAQ
jgi:hypothetical protein